MLIEQAEFNQPRYPEMAARHAYSAMFHVAQALIFEKTGRLAKTHRGTSAEFARLTTTAPWPNPEMRGLLSRAYRFKEVADYGTEPQNWPDAAQAAELIKAAHHFIDFVATLCKPRP